MSKRPDGEMLTIDNPLNFPNPGEIEYAEEPIVKASIITPSDYVGNLMELCQERRGIYKDMKYLDTNRVELHYELPLNEIIYDFFDALKSRTRGYASLDYEMLGYQQERAGEAGHPAQRRCGGCPVLHRPHGKGL